MIVQQLQDGVTINIKVVPNASSNEIAGSIGDRLKVRVMSPPESGKANVAVCAVIALALRVRKSDVFILKGDAHAQKTVGVNGISLHAARSQLHV